MTDKIIHPQFGKQLNPPLSQQEINAEVIKRMENAKEGETFDLTFVFKKGRSWYDPNAPHTLAAEDNARIAKKLENKNRW